MLRVLKMCSFFFWLIHHIVLMHVVPPPFCLLRHQNPWSSTQCLSSNPNTILMSSFWTSSNILRCASFADLDCCILNPCSLTVPPPVCCELWRVFCVPHSMDQISPAYVCLGFGLVFEELTFFQTAGHRGWLEMICWRGSKSWGCKSGRLPTAGPLVLTKPGRKIHKISILQGHDICVNVCVCIPVTLHK